jgi:hypothetical protein
LSAEIIRRSARRSSLFLKDNHCETGAFSAATRCEHIKAKLCTICEPENICAPENSDRQFEIATATYFGGLGAAGIGGKRGVDCGELPFARF